MIEKVKDGAAKSSARRRLIRGAFAAPAALTLYSGNTIAQASVSCVARQVSSPVPPNKNPSDAWVRVSVWKHTRNGVETKLVSGTEIAALQGTAGNSFIVSGEWKQVVSPFDSYTPTTLARPIRTEKFRALRIDASGVIVGIDDGKSYSGSSAVARSCWTSFSGVGFSA